MQVYDFEERLVDSSKLIADVLTLEIGNCQEKYDEMMLIAMKDIYPASMRAARIIQLCTFNHPDLFKKHISDIINALHDIQVDGVKRGFLKIFIEMPVFYDEESIGQLTETVFDFLKDREQSIAVRAYSMDVILKIIRIFPDLQLEAMDIIESISDYESGALKSRCLKILAKYRKRTLLHR